MIQYGDQGRHPEVTAVAGTLRSIYDAGIRGTGEGVGHTLVPAPDGLRTQVDFTAPNGIRLGVVASPDEVNAQIMVEEATVRVPTNFGFVTSPRANFTFRPTEAVVDTGYLDQDGSKVQLPVSPELLGTIGRVANHFKEYQPSGRSEVGTSRSTDQLRRRLSRLLGAARTVDAYHSATTPYILRREEGTLMRLAGPDPYGDVATAVVHMPDDIHTGDIAVDMILGSRGDGVILATEEGETAPCTEPAILIYPESVFVLNEQTDTLQALLPSTVSTINDLIHKMRLAGFSD